MQILLLLNENIRADTIILLIINNLLDKIDKAELFIKIDLGGACH